MQLNELISMVNYIDEVITSKPKLVLEYHSMVNLFNQVRQDPSPQHTKQLNDAKNNIIKLQNSIQPKDWGYLKTKLFKRYGAYRLIGIGAVEELNTLLENNKANPAGAAQEVQNIINDLKKLNTNIKQLKSSLGSLTEEFEEEEVEEGKAILYLVFEEDASIKTIKDMEDYSKQWRRILSGFFKFAKEPQEDAKIYSIEKGSLILGLIGKVTLITLIARGTSEMLGIYKKVLEIKKAKLEVENLELKNDKIKSGLKGLDEELKSLIEKKSQEVVKNLMKEYKGKSETDKQEVENHINISLRQIFDFVEKGGKIDFTDPNKKEDSKEKRELINSFNDVKSIESEVEELKALEAKNPAQDD